MVNALVQKQVNVIIVLTSGTIRVRKWQFCTYDNTGDTPHGRKQLVDYYLSEFALQELWFSFNTHKSFAFY